MTTRLRRARKVLQCAGKARAAWVEREVERSPLRERDEGAEGEESDRAEADAPAGEAEADPAPGEAAAAPLDSPDPTHAAPLPTAADAPTEAPMSLRHAHPP